MRSSPTRSAPALLVVLAVVGALVVGAVVALGLVAAGDSRGAEPQPRPPPVTDRALRAARPEVRAAHLLRAWDERRAAAWAADDADALLALYAPGSPAGRHDRAMLLTWRRRGLHVDDLATQVVRLGVVAHRPGRYEVEVVDRLAGGTAVGAGTRRELPRDAPSTRRVVLVQRAGGWVVASVSAAPSRAPR